LIIELNESNKHFNNNTINPAIIISICSTVVIKFFILLQILINDDEI